MTQELDHLALYRLPWNLTDNTIAWLEPTSQCNLYCEGCYRENVKAHKSLAEISDELDVFAKFRKFDGVSIAGGDPLTHPDVAKIVELCANRGYKPVLNTNGLALTEPLLRDLKNAGVVGFTFHVDSGQTRPKWKGKTEIELNELRLTLAQMVANAGNISCAFNSTVYGHTLKHVPELVAWAQEHIDIVHVMVFILYRAAVLDGDFDYYAGGQRVNMKPLAYSYPSNREQRVDLNAREVVQTIRQRFPDFEPSAYLNGTENADTFKWLMAGRLGTRNRIYGYVGPKSVELVQTAHHLWTGRYLAYAPPAMLRRGKLMLALAPFDKGIRRAALSAVRDPRLLREPLYYQSIAIIQPIDVLPDGRQSMCDGCPDMTVFNGQLSWSCRLEECLKFGQFIRTVPKEANQSPAAAPPT